MKTQILKLEVHDDIGSIRDKLTWHQTGRILLEFPQHRDGGLHKRLNRPLDLRLLKRAAERLGAQIAFLTRNETIRQTAAEVGISVFQDLNQAHTERWRIAPSKSVKPEISPPYPISRLELDRLYEGFRPKNTTRVTDVSANAGRQQLIIRVACLGCAFLCVLLLTWLCLVPRTIIRLALNTQVQEFTIPIRISPKDENVHIRGVLPAERFSVIVEGTDSLKVSGLNLFTKENARGKVVFNNLTISEIHIPAGTRVSSSTVPSLKFLTTEDTRLAAGFVDPTEPSPAVTVVVEAAYPGSTSNLPAGSIDTIHGMLGANMTVTNPEPLTGGSEELLPCSTMRDKRILRERLEKRLIDQAKNELAKAVGVTGKEVGGVLLTEKPQISRIIEEKYVPEDINTPANNLALSLQIEYQAWGVAGEDLASTAMQRASYTVPTGYTPIEDSLEIGSEVHPLTSSAEHSLDEDGGWEVVVRQKILKDIQQHVFYKRIILRTPQKAAEVLKDALLLEKNPQISISPSWLPILPPLPGQYAFEDDVFPTNNP